MFSGNFRFPEARKSHYLQNPYIQSNEEPVLLDERKKSEKKLPMEWILGHAYKDISTSETENIREHIWIAVE